MKLSNILLLLLWSLPLFLSAQDLPRKGTFGAHMDNHPTESGIRILKVIEASTAAAMGLQAGDLLLSVNEKPYTEVGELVRAIGDWSQGDDITAVVQRKGSQQILSAQVLGKPLETSEYGDVHYGSVNFDGGQLRSILILPQGVENPPVVHFLPGIGCGSLDYYYDPGAPIKLLTEALVKNGIAVYRVEKPGMGDSRGTQDCLEMDFDYEVAAFRASLQTLKQMESVNTKQIFLYGHSLGVVSAPLIAAQNEVAGIIAWGGVSQSWFEYSMKLLKDQKVLTGQDYVQIEQDFRKLLPFYYDFYVRQKTPEEFKKYTSLSGFCPPLFSGRFVVWRTPLFLFPQFK